MLAFLARAHESGLRVCALGASTKGNVVLQYCNISTAQVANVGEVNVEKYGCFTPGTLLPIVPQSQVLAEKPDLLLVLPWHFRSFFTGNPQFAGRRLVFPLPSLDVVAV